jgi:hypothetical protein
MKLFRTEKNKDIQKGQLESSSKLSGEEKKAAESVIEQLVEKLNAIISPN